MRWLYHTLMPVAIAAAAALGAAKVFVLLNPDAPDWAEGWLMLIVISTLVTTVERLLADRDRMKAADGLAEAARRVVAIDPSGSGHGRLAERLASYEAKS